MADGTITFSTALDNKQLDAALRKATRDVDNLKRKIEKGGDDRSYIASKLKAAMKAAQDARAEIDRLQASMGVEGGSKELAQHIREAAKEAERLAKPLEEKRAQRTAIEEEMDRIIAKEEATVAKIEELEAKADELRARGDTRGVGDVLTEASPYKVQLYEQDAQIEELRAKWEALGNEVQEYETEIEGANAAVADMQGYMGAMQAAEATLKQQESDASSLEAQWNRTDEKVKEYERDLSRAETRASELAADAGRQAPIWQRAAEAVRSRFAAAAEGIRASMADAANKSAAPWEQFANRVGTMLRRVFVFSIILKGLNAIKNEIGSMLMQNETFAASVANLKAVFMGFASSLVSAVMPTLVALANTIAAVFTRVAGLIDAIFGTKIVAAINAQAAAASQAAGATGNQAKAAKELAKEQKEANRQVMAFDEINAMSDSGSDDGSGGSGGGGGGGGGGVGGIGSDLGGGVFQGILDWIDKIKDRILNDLEGPFARIREGLQRIAKGWQELVEGFRRGDLGMIWKGITDIIVGACYVIEGAFAALMDWLDEQTGGRFTNIFQGLSEIVSGFVKVIEGLLTGDLGLILDGVVQILLGVQQTIVGILEGIKTLFGDLMDWLDEQTGGRFHDIFEGLKGIVGGLADYLIGLVTLDLPLVFQGARELLDGAAQFLQGIVDLMVGIVKSGVDLLFDWLEKRFPQFAGPLEALRASWKRILDSIGDAFKVMIEGAHDVLAGYLDIMMGMLVGDAEQIKQGVEELVGGIRDTVTGLLSVLSDLVSDAFSSLRKAVTESFDYLAGKFPELKDLFSGIRDFIVGVLEFLESTVTGIIEGVSDMARGALDGLIQIVNGIIDVVCGIFEGNGERIIDGMRGIVNGFISVVEGLLDGVIDGIVGFVNGITRGLSVLPGVSIPSISFSSVSLPRLATGAVIPPNREFLAVLGDQTSGNNIETPEGLLRQVLREEIGPMLADAILALSSQGAGGGGDVNLVLKVDSEELSRAVSRGNASRVRRGDLVPDVDLAFGL